MKAASSSTAEASAQRATLDWLVRVAAPLLGLAGAVLYGVLRLAYLTFYLQVRATPEEVGYGYVEILATQLVGAIELVLIVAALAFVAVVAAQYLTSMVRRRTHPRRPRLDLSLSREKMLRVARRSLVVSMLIVVVMLPCMAWLLGAEAKKGFAIHNVYPRGFIVLPILGVQAVPAQVEWVSETGRAPIGDRECLLYLGANDGTAVFYDVRTRDSLRLPTSAISIVLTFKSGTPTDCYESR